MGAAFRCRFMNCWALATSILAATLLFSGELALSCDTDVQGLISKCEQFVLKGGPMAKPSHECCAVVKKVNIPCVCSLVTKDIEEVVSMEKVVYVARSCGKKISPRTKCGSYTVPGA